jgi:hypothetical protein
MLEICWLDLECNAIGRGRNGAPAQVERLRKIAEPTKKEQGRQIAWSGGPF